MDNEKLPSVSIDAQTWKKISAEVSHWAECGKRMGIGPLECVFYPLSALKLRRERALTPFEEIRLEDVEKIIVGDVFLPPREYAHYSSHFAHFKAPEGQEEKMRDDFTKGVSKINKRFPQLLFLGPGHSHPFAVGWTYPSGTDIEHHIRPYRRKNEDLLGCSFSLALIIVQSRTKRRWEACAFAMNSQESVHFLGVAQIVSTQSGEARFARSKPYYRTRRGRIWETRQRAVLGNHLIEHERWPGGWTSFLIKRDEEKASLVMLPPSFPREKPLEQTVYLQNRLPERAERLDLGRAYKNYRLGGEADAEYLKLR